MNGISLHLGLNAVNPDHYAGWSGPLAACENDAVALAELAAAGGFMTTTLLTRSATAAALLDAISAATRTLEPGQRFLLTCASHGSQLPDSSEEADGLDETWLLYDRMLVDDELYAALNAFKPGVEVFVLSDSCHSGTILRSSAVEGRSRIAPPAVVTATHRKHRAMYDAARADAIRRGSRPGTVDLLLISACQDDQLAAEDDANGLFTGTLLRVWANGRFIGDYESLWRAIVLAMPLAQVPNLLLQGPAPARLTRARPFLAEEDLDFFLLDELEPTKHNTEEQEMKMNQDMNGNWSDMLLTLEKSLQGKSQADLAVLIDENASNAQRTFFGPLTRAASSMASTGDNRESSRGGTVTRAFWWGFHIQISHEDLRSFVQAAHPVNALIGAIGVGVPSPATPFIALAAAFIAGALGLLSGLDKGRGVYVSMSWFLPGLFIPTSV